MAILEDVARFVRRLSPEPVCDACIVERLSPVDSGEVARSTLELAGSTGFERRREPCSLCGSDRMVIRKS